MFYTGSLPAFPHINQRKENQIRFEGSKHRAMLLEIEKYCESIGAKVYKKEYEAEEVIAQMGDREAMLTLHSPIFTDEERRETLTELVVEKLY